MKCVLQTEVEGFQNLHGHREGWAWLARFLNAVPANLFTATALQAFLEVCWLKTFSYSHLNIFTSLTSNFFSHLDIVYKFN